MDERLAANRAAGAQGVNDRSALTLPGPQGRGYSPGRKMIQHIREDGDLAGLPDLDRSMVIDQATRQAFARDGHVLVPGLLTPEEAATYGAAVREAHGRGGPVGMWRRSATVARFVCARLFGQVAADLMGADGMRLYHDTAFWKQPGEGPTSWHQDCTFLPLPGDSFLTMWMPLNALPDETGGLSFATGSHRGGCLLGATPGEHDRSAWPEHTYPDVRPGDATFHVGTVHHAGPGNPSRSTVREVITVIYFVDGIRALPPRWRQHEVELRQWLPGVAPGEPAVSPLTPLVFSRAPATGT
jgi:Phytanoyl-CoA dioxygenase (PhyH)